MRIPRTSNVSSNTNRSSVGLTNVNPLSGASLTFNWVFVSNPVPRTLTTVPAGQMPSPGTTSEIEVSPPTVTVPGVIVAVVEPSVEWSNVDNGSIVNLVFEPTIASARTGSATVKIG